MNELRFNFISIIFKSSTQTAQTDIFTGVIESVNKYI